MRDVLFARIQPLVDRLANDITELAVRRVEAELERMGEAFAVALSAYASETAPDLLTKALGPELAQMLDAPKRPRVVSEEPRPGVLRVTAAQPEVVRPAAPKDGAPKSPVCSKCQQAGHNARTCGRAIDSGVVPPGDRRAAIAALASKPKTDAPIAVAGDDEDDEAWPASRIKEETARAEGRKHKGELPTPRSSFRVDRNEVTELDFGTDRS